MDCIVLFLVGMCGFAMYIFLFRYMYICQINFLEIIDNLEPEVEVRAEAEKQGTGKSAVLVEEEEDDVE